jgi:hypothetical protein
MHNAALGESANKTFGCKRIKLSCNANSRYRNNILAKVKMVVSTQNDMALQPAVTRSADTESPLADTADESPLADTADESPLADTADDSSGVSPDPRDGTTLVQEALRWSQNGWTAQVIKNEDDDGWAVAMTMEGASEPSLVGPWTMGRDKKSPKPLDNSAFTTLVKTANEIVMRHAQQTHAALHKSTKVATPAGRVRVLLDIVADEDNPHAILSAYDDSDAQLAKIRVAANYRFDHTIASAWVASGYAPVPGTEF